MSDPESDPWQCDDLDTAILNLDRGTLKARLPDLALVPDLDAIDFARLSRLARIYPPKGGRAQEKKRLVFVPDSAMVDEGDGRVRIDPDACVDVADWHAESRRLEFEGNLRASIERAWKAYYWAARSVARRSPRAAELDDRIAKSLSAAAKGLRQRGLVRDRCLARYIESRYGWQWRRARAADDPFRRFLLGELRYVRHYGGRLTFDRATGTGTIIDFIEALRPLLPPRFVPTWAQPPSYIERLGTEVRRKVRPAAPLDGLVLVPAEVAHKWFGGAPFDLRCHIDRHIRNPLLRRWRSSRRPSRGARRARTAEPDA
jgi:hypothetical protein